MGEVDDNETPWADTAVITMELQRGVVGESATMPALRDAVAEVGLLGSVRSLLEAARAASMPVVHATVSWREDRRGTPLNTPLARGLGATPGHLLHGSEAAELHPGIGADPAVDLIAHRHHGMTPFTGTDLDALLRSLGVRRLVICGVSLNVGIIGAVIEAVGLGYGVVVPTDGVVGIPVAYGSSVVQNSLRPLATLSTTDDLIAAWR